MNPRSFSALVILAVLFTNLVERSGSERVKKHPGHGRPFGSSGPFLNLDETSDLSTRDFFDNYVRPKKALIIRGMASKFPAHERWSSDNYLREISRSYNDHKLLVETQKKESRDQNIISLSLNEFLDEYKRKEIYIVDEVPVYMKGDLVLPQQLQCGQAPETVEKTVRLFRII